jgi:hypothetical protein
VPRIPFGVEYHDDKKHGFSDNTPDDEWLAKIAHTGWIVLSHDNLHKNAMAVAAIKQHRLKCFCLEGAQAPVWDKITVLARGYRGICDTVSSVKAPYIYRVARASGKLTRIEL